MYVSSIEKAIYVLKLDSSNEGALPLTLPVCFPNDDNNETSIKLKYYPLSEVLSHLALVMVEWKIKKMVSIELWLSSIPHNIRAIMAKIKLPKNPLSMVIF